MAPDASPGRPRSDEASRGGPRFRGVQAGLPRTLGKGSASMTRETASRRIRELRITTVNNRLAEKEWRMEHGQLIGTSPAPRDFANRPARVTAPIGRDA